MSWCKLAAELLFELKSHRIKVKLVKKHIQRSPPLGRVEEQGQARQLPWLLCVVARTLERPLGDGFGGNGFGAGRALACKKERVLSSAAREHQRTFDSPRETAFGPSTAG